MIMQSNFNKKELALQVIERLKKEYPEAKCTLDYDKAWQLLVSVRLAAQCTDARVDQITPKSTRSLLSYMKSFRLSRRSRRRQRRRSKRS